MGAARVGTYLSGVMTTNLDHNRRVAPQASTMTSASGCHSLLPGPSKGGRLTSGSAIIRRKAAKEVCMPDNVYKVIELVGTSEESGRRPPRRRSSAPLKASGTCASPRSSSRTW